MNLTESGRILGIFNHPARSHTFLGTVLFEELASRGHEVVFLNAYPAKSTLGNYRNIVIEGIAADLLNREMIYFEHKSNQDRIIYESVEMSLVHMTATFENPELKKMFASNETFDLIITDYFYNDANLILGHVFKAPVIMVSSFGNTLATTHLSGNELPFSYVPGCSIQLSDAMNFWGRFKMTVFGSNLLWRLRHSKKKHLELLKHHFKNVPSMEELYDNVALVLTNSHYSFETPRPFTPNVIPVGGFHVQKSKSLPEDLQKLIKQSEKGVIYFSLGSQIKSSNMKKETIAAIVDTFAKFDILVLWKFEKENDFPLPKNVIMRDWFPQIDLLATANVKVFITHAGLLSMIETLHYGVPMIAIPFNGDQHMNSKFIETRKIGKMINLEDIHEKSFSEVVKEVLHNPMYQQNVLNYSNLLRNQPIKPLDNAVFWIEHVIQHKGALHLRPSSLKLSWYQYYLIDVYAVIFIVILIVSILLILLTKYATYMMLYKVGFSTEMQKEKQF